jgi:hypothetical protein
VQTPSTVTPRLRKIGREAYSLGAFQGRRFRHGRVPVKSTQVRVRGDGAHKKPTDKHFSHAWLDHGGAEGDLMELNGWASPRMLRRYGASARSARVRRSYDRVMDSTP